MTTKVLLYKNTFLKRYVLSFQSDHLIGNILINKSKMYAVLNSVSFHIFSFSAYRRIRIIIFFIPIEGLERA